MFKNEGASIAAKIIESSSIFKSCQVEHQGSTFRVVDAGDTIQHILRFVQLLKEEGDTLFRRKEYDSARDFYTSAMLITSEWEDHLSSENLKTQWHSYCLDIISLETDNIKSLAISSYTFRSFGAKCLLGAERRHFKGLEELIILTDTDMENCIRVLKEQNSDFPKVQIITEKMLTDKFLEV